MLDAGTRIAYDREIGERLRIDEGDAGGGIRPAGTTAPPDPNRNDNGTATAPS
jgi:hypothetical protein